MEKTKEDVIEALDNFRGINGTLLSYVVRDSIKVKPEADDPAADYASIDEEMKARAPIVLDEHVGTRTAKELEDAPMAHLHPAFKADAITAYGKLRAIFGDTAAWIYAKSIKNKMGRKVFIAIFEHYLGDHHITFVISEVHSTLRAAHYGGEKRNFKFENYVNLHRAAHNRLIPLKESDGTAYRGLMESEKVSFLLGGIKTDSLNSCVASIIGSHEMTNDFDKAVKFIQDYIRNTQAQSGFGGNNNRNISEVGSSRAGGGGGGGVARGNPNGRKSRAFTQAEVDKCTHITKAHYPQEEYIKFNAAEKQKVWQNRQKLPEDQRPPPTKKARNASSVEIDKISKGITRIEQAGKRLERRVATIEKCLSDDDASLFSSDDEASNRNNPALVRQPSKKKSKKGGSDKRK